MHISKIELENIKSHVTSSYDFTRGTTAITGENGAGKTTIIEAIAWTLFDLLDYKKEDFLKRGAKKGFVRLTFESGLDEREYVVYRDTATGYHVTDPRLKTRIADKREEVLRFLWQHLGLEPGTDLKSLFRQAIGVPQGTFTAIFLEGATERKAAFDRLLKVEEYRQAAEKLRETSRFLETSISAIREDIARGEGELSRYDTVEKEHADYAGQTQKLTSAIAVAEKDLSARQAIVKDLDAKETAVTQLQTAFERLKAEKEKTELIYRQREEAAVRSADAATKVETVKANAQRHVETLGRLRELERERGERDKLMVAMAKIDGAIANVKAEQKRLLDDLARVASAHSEIERLRPIVVEQEGLEKAIARLRDVVATGRAAAAQVQDRDDKLTRLREAFRENQVRLREAESNARAAAETGTLETRDAELLQSIANLRASLDRDEKFQSEIKNGLCPILSQKCLNLNEGETLEAFVASQFTELRSQITTYEGEHASVATRLAAAREGSRFLTALESYKKRESQLTDEGQRLTIEKADLEKQTAGLPDSESQLTRTEAKLKALDDPGARTRFLEKEAARDTEVREGLSNVESNLERLGAEHQATIEELDKYKELDEQWATLSGERDEGVEAYRVFLANTAEAEALGERQIQMEAAKKDLLGLEGKLAPAEKELAHAQAEYDRDNHNVERASLRETENRYHVMRANLDAAKSREEQLAAELLRFKEIRRSLEGEFKEKERLENVAGVTAFIRDTLKEAAPRVARNYVHHVSLEANQMFREITGNAERTLKWAEDYSIVLEEDGYERPFVSLSGGEQMSAALAVRLALLKQLSDIRVAFFDEPTTNLDAERRENFAMQISRITHFDQLFVISHDDSFDSYVDHVISIGH